MRFTIYLFLFFLTTVKGQEYVVLNEINRMPLPFVHIDFLNGTGTTSDSNGKFTFFGPKINVTITSVGFKPLTIDLKNIDSTNIIFLQENTIELDEVSLFNKKTKLLKHKSPIKIGSSVRDFTYDETVVTFIPYPKIDSDNVIIKNIVINTTGLHSKKRRYYPFKVNLYKVNKKYYPPKLEDSLFLGRVTSRKKGKPNLVKINIQEQNVSFPKEGIYVSFETLDERHYPKDTLYKIQKKIQGISATNYNRYASAVKTINTKSLETNSYSYSLIRRYFNNLSGEKIKEEKWKFEKDFIYDITLEIKY